MHVIRDCTEHSHIPADSLVLGDCLSLMDKIPDRTVDAIICDLPYGTTANGWDAVIPFGDMWRQYGRIIKPKGNIVLFAHDMFAFSLAMSNPQKFRYSMVWVKSKCGSALTARFMPLKKHEFVLVFGERASYYEPQMKEGKPYSRKATPSKSNNHGYGISGNRETVNEGTRHPSTVLDYPQQWRRQDQLHPTQKPVPLMEFLVKSYCPEGGLVLDNCMGSGTTCLACVRTDRRFIGMDITEEYFDIAVRRLGKEMDEEEKNSLF